MRCEAVATQPGTCEIAARQHRYRNVERAIISTDSILWPWGDGMRADNMAYLILVLAQPPSGQTSAPTHERTNIHNPIARGQHKLPAHFTAPRGVVC